MPDPQSCRASSLLLSKSQGSKKRIIVCCDGTWQDGITVQERWKYTNVLKLSRALNHVDVRHDVPISQVVFYQNGVGSSIDFPLQSYLEGATAFTLADKVQEAYAFIAQNYSPGDEIFLFGFSRGAYTARMVASFIGAIGVLDKNSMDHFGEIFFMYQSLGKTTDPAEVFQLQGRLAKWTSSTSPGNARVGSGEHSFSIKCVGVFDTVGAVGLPTEITRKCPSITSIFGFVNTELGSHIERAYHAMAINETRADFDCCKFKQTPEGRTKGQILKQCWFSGSHSDIGGGFKEHDLSDLTLTWMLANIEDMLSVDHEYVASLLEPTTVWGQQSPHDPSTGIFRLAEQAFRQLPTATDDITHETIHPSVLEQGQLPSQLKGLPKDNALLCELLPLEAQVKAGWHCSPSAKRDHDVKDKFVQMSAESNTKETVTLSPQDARMIYNGTETSVTTRLYSNDSASASQLAYFASESHFSAMAHLLYKLL